jgi:O-antigen/teichoic acid export membrane protein
VSAEIDEARDMAAAATAVAAPNATEMTAALGNALKLGLSVMGTILVAVVVRIYVPRHLGPELFGQLNFADAYAATFFSFATFGVDTYIRKEVATRLSHASEFYGGFFLLRLLTSVVIFVLMGVGLYVNHKQPLIWHLVLLFGLGRVAYIDSYTATAFLQAAGEFNEISWMNVASKIMWGSSIAAGLHYGQATVWIAGSFLASEATKTAYLLYVVHKKLHLNWQVHVAPTWAVVKKSFPYFINGIALQIYAYLNVIMLDHLSTNKEVGWYGATMTLASFAGLFVPVMQAVIMPMAARMALRSEEEMNELMRGTARLIIAAISLLSLVFMLHADTVARLAFGAAYAPAAQSLQIIAPMFPLTYLATILALHLIQQNRNWTLTRISLFNVVLNPLLNAPLIMWGVHSGIAGRAGAMSALATTITETFTVMINMWLLGSAAVDRRFWQTLGRTAALCAGIIALHYGLPGLGLWRLPLEVVAYLSCAVLLGTLPVGELRRLVQQARNSRLGKP